VVQSFLERDWGGDRLKLLTPSLVMTGLLRTVSQPVMLLKGRLYVCHAACMLSIVAWTTLRSDIQENLDEACILTLFHFAFCAGDGYALMQQAERLVSHCMASGPPDQ